MARHLDEGTEELRALRSTKNFLTREAFTEVLKHNGIPETQHRTLGRWLHELGEIIYHDKDNVLRRYVLLNSQWVSNIVCRVLQSREVANRKGVLTLSHLRMLWRDLPDEDLQDSMLKLMQSFDLAYDVKTDASEDISLVVDRVPHDPTPECFNIWDGISVQYNCNEIAIKYQFDHQLTAGIPTWLIARQHRFSIGEHWRRGILFAESERKAKGSAEDPSTSSLDYKHLALIEADHEKRTVRLRVRGPHPVFFFSQIKDGFEDTLKKLPNPKYTILVPCPGHGEDRDRHACTGEFRLEKLDEFEEKGKRFVQCPEAGEDVSIYQLRYGLRITDTARRLAQVVEATEALSKDDIAYLQLASVKAASADHVRDDEILPFIFWLRPFEENRQLSEMLKQKFYLHLCCECPGFFHPLTTDYGSTDPEKGRYLIENISDLLREWGATLEKVASTIDFAKKPLSFLIKAIAGIPDVPGVDSLPKLAEKVTKSVVPDQIRELTPSPEGLIAIPDLNEDHRYFYRAEGATYRQLIQLLLQLDKSKVLGD